jgi:hypothetical protein
MVKLSRPVSRSTVKAFAHYKRPIVVTLVPGTDERDDLITTRLKGTREKYVARIADVHRLMALWHASKVSAAKRAARKDGIPWARAKREFQRQNAV